MMLNDRIEIQECLNKGMTFKAIGQRIKKDQTTVSKEVKLHEKVHANGFTKTDECCPKLLKAPFVCKVALKETIAIVNILEGYTTPKQRKRNTRRYWLNQEKAYHSQKKNFTKPKRSFHPQ